jgi:ATP-dependent DNA helicase RecQ
MVQYTASDCRRRYIVEYFGEKAPLERCGTCDGCRDGGDDRTLPRALSPEEETVVLKLLSCVARMEQKVQRAESGFSADMIAKVVTGSSDERLRKFGFDSLSTFGILGPRADGEGARTTTWTTGEIADLLAALAAAGAMTEQFVTREVADRQRTYKEYRVSELGWRVMRRTEADFRMVFPHASRVSRRSKNVTRPPNVPGELIAILREVRSQLAEKDAVPVYVVAPNKTLEEMAEIRPTTRKAMLTLHGWGEARHGKYGELFLAALREWNTAKRPV